MIEIKSGKPEFDDLWGIVEEFLKADVREIDYQGRIVRGYRSPDCPYVWFRDHIHMMEATVYLEADIKNAITFMLDMQQEDGHFHDFISPEGEMLRVPTEADVEYLAVIGVYRAWRASGDNKWMEDCLPKLAKVLEYCTTHPWRWDEKHGMIKRAYTIDTWDFDYREDLEEIHWPGKIDEKTHFGIMHGDNSGLFYAYVLMSQMLEALNRHNEAVEYGVKGEELRDRVNKLLFNGRFYRHRYPLDDARIPGVDEEAQLSLSNAYNLNRGLPTEDMARSIIKEYMSRRDPKKAFAEWYSIDPPFPVGVFGSDKLVPGSYVNGGIMPLVGGELARGAFRWGFSEYGVDILRRYYELVMRTGESYLWYFPDGKAPTAEESTSPEALPTDGWGSSAMIAALVEGLAGIEDDEFSHAVVHFSPRWVAAGVDDVEVKVRFAASGWGCSYEYHHDPVNHIIRVKAQHDWPVVVSVLLPKDAVMQRTEGGMALPEIRSVGDEDYVDIALPKPAEDDVVEVFYDFLV
jgi:hypothetical protein